MPEAVTPEGAVSLALGQLSYCHLLDEPNMVADAAETILTNCGSELGQTEVALLAEVAELGRVISSAKEEIAALRMDDISVSHIPSATDELDAIVAHTASATNSILETCETLDQVSSGLAGETATQLQDATTRIYEACGFQDITGQRITKVVATLKVIEAKVGQIMATFGARDPGAEKPAPLADVRLLNGPQLPANAMGQTDIDKLLASFD